MHQIERQVFCLTGATGFLGCQLLVSLVHRYKKIIVVVRAESKSVAKSRLLAKMNEAALSMHKKPDLPLWESVLSVYSGDVTEYTLGLSQQDLNEIGMNNIDMVFHFAGNLKYEDRYRSEIFEVNVKGTQNTLELAAMLNVDRFVHISTAFVAGRETGQIEEELRNSSGGFNNAYEESKCHAEHLVIEYCGKNGIDAKILRPAIVVGPSVTLWTGGSATGLYGIVNLLNRTKGAFSSLGRDPIIVGDKNTPAYISPVDYFVGDTLYLLDQGFPGGPIYHAMCETTLNAQHLIDAFHQEIGTPHFTFKESFDGDPSTIESMYDKFMKLYGAACRYPKYFVRSLPEQPSITIGQLRGYVAECVIGMQSPEL